MNNHDILVIRFEFRFSDYQKGKIALWVHGLFTL